MAAGAEGGPGGGGGWGLLGGCRLSHMSHCYCAAFRACSRGWAGFRAAEAWRGDTGRFSVGDCQGAPPSCRLVKMGKPDGNDPTYWEESWDTWGALDFNATHVIRASWATCPTAMDDKNRIPCAFGSESDSTNCDDEFAPNLAPPKRNPSEPWLPNGFQGHPTGPSVIAHFCGDGCEWDGEVPAMPPKTATISPTKGQTAVPYPGTSPDCPAGCRVAGPRASVA